MTPAERYRREEKRLRAASWFAEKVPQAEVARRLGVSPQAVSKWHRALLRDPSGQVPVPEAFASRTASPAKKALPQMAQNTYAWFNDEPGSLLHWGNLMRSPM